MKQIHSLTNVDKENCIATCSLCGEGTKIRFYRGSRRCLGREFAIRRSEEYRVTHTRSQWQARMNKSFTKEEVRALLAIENCASCGASRADVGALHLDHCHDTDKVRGMLCHGCNVGIGYFGNSPDKLRAAIIYLENSLANSPESVKVSLPSGNPPAAKF